MHADREDARHGSQSHRRHEEQGEEDDRDRAQERQGDLQRVVNPVRREVLRRQETEHQGHDEADRRAEERDLQGDGDRGPRDTQRESEWARFMSKRNSVRE